MVFLSLVFTNKIDKKTISNFLSNDKGFCLQKKNLNEEIFDNSHKDISIKLYNYKIELMYDNRCSSDVALFINKLLTFNGNRRISIKIYSDKEKNNLMQLLNMQKCYFV